MAFEIFREYLAIALEATRGTAIANPTHITPFQATLTPMWELAEPQESRGTRARSYRTIRTREWSDFEGEGPLDTYILPVLLNMAVAPVTSPTTPTDAVLSRLWTFTPLLTGDNIKSATVWWGDPEIQVFRSVFALITELGIEADASGTDEARLTISGQAHYQTEVADPTLPSQLVSPLIAPGRQQLWIDAPGGTIGTTAITGRVLGGSATIPTGVVPKWMAVGPAGDLNFTTIGRDYTQIEVSLRFEIPDTTQLDQFRDEDVLQFRWRLNGPLIETEAATDFYHYVEIDFYAPAGEISWGDNEGTNRVAEVTFRSQYDTTAGTDFVIKVQNDRATL